MKDTNTRSEILLELEGISKSFGGLKALDHVNLLVHQGERQAIIGPNGAGKTTLFNVIVGELSQEVGYIRFEGRTINGFPTRKRIQMGIGRTYQITNLFQEMTVEENIFLAVNGCGRRPLRLFKPWHREGGKKGRVMHIAEQVGFPKKLLGTPVKELSYGDQRKLDLSLAIAGNPKVLLLDEPMAGLARTERPQIAGMISDLDPDLAVIIIEHDIETAFDIVGRVTVLHMGQVVTQGDPGTIRADSRVRELYMGT